jgi:uncharacterized protein
MSTIGTYQTLTVLRETASGYYLDGGALGEILLPGTRAPKDLPWGSRVEVFLYPDSEDRLVATTERPLVTAGQFACLEVLSVHPRIGAFLNWGLGKDLLLPYREQGGTQVEPGDHVVVYVKFDERSSRVVATTKWNRYLNATPPRFPAAQKVSALITHRTPLGWHAIVEQSFSGLLYHSNLGLSLEVGQRLEAYIQAIRPDGKIDLSLDPPGQARSGDLASAILTALEAHGGRLAFDDHSSPEAIREAFRTSKKSFKRALATLYKQRRIHFPEDGGIALT